MPWFPDFVNAVQLARRQARTSGEPDAVTRYVLALQEGDAQALEAAWPGEIVVYDPRAGRVKGHDELRAFVKQSQDWLAEREARLETIATTRIEGRAVVELSARLSQGSGVIDWPVAVVAESLDDRSVVFRTYCRLSDVDGLPHLRSPILDEGRPDLPLVVARLLDAFAAGDADEATATLAPAAHVRMPGAPDRTYRGAAELRTFFLEQLDNGGSICLQPCAVTDDGVRCVVEFNCTRWGHDPLHPQPGLGAFERDSSELLTAVRVYHDIQTPAQGGTR